MCPIVDAESGPHDFSGSAEVAAALVRESMARRFKALSHPARLRIVELLAHGSRSVSDLAQLTRLPADTVSKHLRTLAGVNIVRRSQQGNGADDERGGS